jgi:hypothetical protein
VGKLAQGNAVASGVTTQALLNVINERSKSLSMTRSKYVGLIFAWWEAQGCPPVSPADEAVLILKRGKNAKK